MTDKIKAFIFDLDDTLVESEWLNIQLITEYFADTWRIPLDEEDQNIVYGYSWQHIYSFLINKYSISTTADLVQEGVMAKKRQYLSCNRLKVASGLDKVLALPVRKVIVSGSGKEEIRVMLQNVALHDYFEAHFSVDDYVKGKPAPDGFLMAMSYLGVKPEEALVFEDSKSGLTAAREAGVTSIFMKEFAGTDHAAQADYSFNDFSSFHQDFLGGKIQPVNVGT